jgi:hypothetical protein
VHRLRQIADGWRRHRKLRVAYGVLLFALWLWGITDHWNLWVTSIGVFAGLGLGLLLLSLSSSGLK